MMARTLRDFIATGLVTLIISDMSDVNPGFAVVMYAWETFALTANPLRGGCQSVEYLAASYVRVRGIVSVKCVFFCDWCG